MLLTFKFKSSHIYCYLLWLNSLIVGHTEYQAPIDSDVEEEFEQFIEEIEDFLMKQDMGEPLDEEQR